LQSKIELYNLLSVCYDKKQVEKLKGPTERNLVYSGLEEIMCHTMENVLNQAIEQNTTIRLAAYKIAIKRVAHSYEVLGMTL